MNWGRNQQFDVVGDDDVVGAVLARAGLVRQPVSTQMRGPMLQVARPTWLGSPEVPQGVTAPEEEMDFLPFDSLTFDSTNHDGQMISNPQRPFRGERLIMTASYFTAGSPPTDVSGSTVIQPALYVGATQIGATQGSTPLSTFAPNAFGVRLTMPRAGQGTRFMIPVTFLGTIGVGDTVIVTATIIGRSIR